MAQALQTRCSGCGWYIARRADAFDAEYDEYRSNEAAYVSEWEEHTCDMDFYGANMAARPGEEAAYLAALEAELAADAELVEVAAELEQAIVTAQVQVEAQVEAQVREVGNGRSEGAGRGPSGRGAVPHRRRGVPGGADGAGGRHGGGQGGRVGPGQGSRGIGTHQVQGGPARQGGAAQGVRIDLPASLAAGNPAPSRPGRCSWTVRCHPVALRRQGPLREQDGAGAASRRIDRGRLLRFGPWTPTAPFWPGDTVRSCGVGTAAHPGTTQEARSRERPRE